MIRWHGRAGICERKLLRRQVREGRCCRRSDNGERRLLRALYSSDYRPCPDAVAQSLLASRCYSSWDGTLGAEMRLPTGSYAGSCAFAPERSLHC
jgi:hypothetical protein